MFKKLLVPLDGSPLSEAALPYIARLALAAGCRSVTLYHVVEMGGEKEIHLAEGYLRDCSAVVQGLWREAGVELPQMPVLREKVGRSLTRTAGTVVLRFAEAESMDLVAMATHGRSGIDRWLLGSTAEKVVRGSDLPVLLVRVAPGPAPSSEDIGRILAPLDGSELAQEALGPVRLLAERTGAIVTLLHVVPLRYADYAGNDREEAHEYLTTMAEDLKRTGVQAEPRVRRGEPTEEIVREALEQKSDLVVISSHGRTGLARWAFGSVAEQVVRASPAPVLVIRARTKGGVEGAATGPRVRQCYKCGRRTYQEGFTAKDHCTRCRQFLRACRNCAHYDGTECLLQLPDAVEPAQGNECPRFDFRQAPVTLR